MLDSHPWGKDPVIDAILEPYAGLRPDLFSAQQVMTLQCYIDDSGSEPNSEYFVLAGFVASVGEWIRFASDWQDALISEPRLDAFKTVEAMGLAKRFKRDKGWTRALVDERVILLSSIIKKHVKFRICTRVRHEDFYKYIASIPVPRERTLGDNNPYNMLQLHLLTFYWHHCERNGIKERCNFIFDEQVGFEADSRKLYREMKAAFREDYPNSHLSYIGSPPSFRSDIEYLPLQAADLAAWCLRRVSVTGKSGNMPEEALGILSSIPHLSFDLDEATLKKWHDEIAPSVYEAKRQFTDMDWRFK